MAWSTNTPGAGDPFGQRERALAEEEKRLAEEAARLRREMAEKAEREAAEAKLARFREEHPELAAQAAPPSPPVLRHSAMRRRDRARFFVLFGLLIVVILWLVRILS